MVRIDKEYDSETNDGTRTLRERFGGRSQLFVYHFMHGPSTPEGCGLHVCGDHSDGGVAHLEQHDVTFLCARLFEAPGTEQVGLETTNVLPDAVGAPQDEHEEAAARGDHVMAIAHISGVPVQGAPAAALYTTVGAWAGV